MRIYFVVMMAACVVGCSDTNSSADGGHAAPVQQAAPVQPPPADGGGISIAPPPSTAASTPLPGAPGVPVAPAGISSKDEANGEVSIMEDGARLEGEALLKKAMMQHVEGKGFPYPERIEELVEKGTLKSLPPAPNGQKWAIDPATRKIILK